MDLINIISIIKIIKLEDEIRRNKMAIMKIKKPNGKLVILNGSYSWNQNEAYNEFKGYWLGEPTYENFIKFLNHRGFYAISEEISDDECVDFSIQ